MKFQATVNIWNLSQEEIAKLQPGQWVRAGNDTDPNSLGRFYGVKPSGTVVVAWQGNAKGRGPGGYRKYQKTIHHYANA